MNDIAETMDFEQFKSELNKEMTTAANSFVRIGYLLKLARDDEHILEGSGYSDVNDFALKEYGLDKTQVSRFIRITERFSIGGNSTQLLPEYEGYGPTKLSIMLTLPDEINEEMTPEMSKSDIQALKEDYDEEGKITPIELALEEKPQDEPDEFIALVVKHLHDEHPEPAELMKEAVDAGGAIGVPSDWDYENDAIENYMPDGDKIYNIRIEGQGRFMVSCKESGISIINMRNPAEKTPLTWKEFAKAAVEDVSRRDFGKKPERPETVKAKPKKVEKSKPKKETVAPVQPKEEAAEKVEGEVVEAKGQPKDSEGQQDDQASGAQGQQAETEGSQGQQDDQDDRDDQKEQGAPGQQEEKEAAEKEQLAESVVGQLEKIIQEIKNHQDGPDWIFIRDELRGVIKEITDEAEFWE